MKQVIALVDLDDTLFQTKRKCPPGVPEGSLTAIGFDSAGAPMSFATPAQKKFIDWISETALIIPVTARSLAALRRVNLPFRAAVCAHGGLILSEDGAPDQHWDTFVHGQAVQHAQSLEVLVQGLSEAAALLSIPVDARIQYEGDIPLYALARHQNGNEIELRAVADAVAPSLMPGWTDHRNSNAVAFLPPYLGKEHAVAHIMPGLRARFPDVLVIGMGDSLTDAPFMHLCDLAMTPTGSQLAQAAMANLVNSN